MRKKPESVDENEDFVISDKIDVWGDNPGWDPSYVKAYRVNYLGQVGICWLGPQLCQGLQGQLPWSGRDKLAGTPSHDYCHKGAMVLP